MPRNADLKTQAYRMIKNKLIMCEYAPGDIINEAMLAEEYHLSRTPIREALALIEQEGYIRIMPKRGIRVTEISLSDVKQIFQTRSEIEPVALMLAFPFLPKDELLHFKAKFAGDEPNIKTGFLLDTAMHMFIIEHCGNRFIIEMMRKVFEENTRVIISSKQNSVKIHDAREEHMEVLDLLLQGRAREASASMKAHIGSCERAAMAYFFNQAHQTAVSNPVLTYKTALENVTY